MSNRYLTKFVFSSSRTSTAMFLECFEDARACLHVFLDFFVGVHKFRHKVNDVVYKILRDSHNPFQGITEDNVTLRTNVSGFREYSVCRRIATHGSDLQAANGDWSIAGINLCFCSTTHCGLPKAPNLRQNQFEPGSKVRKMAEREV